MKENLLLSKLLLAFLCSSLPSVHWVHWAADIVCWRLHCLPLTGLDWTGDQTSTAGQSQTEAEDVVSPQLTSAQLTTLTADCSLATHIMTYHVTVHSPLLPHHISHLTHHLSEEKVSLDQNNLRSKLKRTPSSSSSSSSSPANIQDTRQGKRLLGDSRLSSHIFRCITADIYIYIIVHYCLCLRLSTYS